MEQRKNLTWYYALQDTKESFSGMESYSEVSIDDLIDYNADESTGSNHSSWTEQALDLFISNLKNVKKSNFSSQRKMLEIITIKMSQKGYRFTLDQIESKYNSLRKMYIEKKERNQIVEPELCKLFEDNLNNRHRPSQPDHLPTKRPRFESLEEDTQEDGDDKRIIWSPEATKVFLDLLEQLRPQLGSKLPTKKQMWKEICCRLRIQGYNFTYSQVENKWKALLRHYRNRLELMRSGVSKPNHSSWPVFFEDEMKLDLKELKQSNLLETDISFANDQKLPYADDGYADDESFQFEEALSLPYVEVSTEESDPVMVSNPKAAPQKPEELPSNPTQVMERIANEIKGFRQDTQKHQDELIKLKKQELEAYKERTSLFSKMANDLTHFVAHLRRDGQNATT